MAEAVKPRGRTLQLKLDAARIYSLIQQSDRSHTHISALRSSPPSDDEEPIAHQVGLPSLPSVSHQARIIRYHLLHSTRLILDRTLNSLVSPNQPDHIRNFFGFVPTISVSTVPSAGRGLFVDGTVTPGSIVALYPGVSYLPSQLRNAHSPNTRSEQDKDSPTHSARPYDAHDTSSPLSDYAIARYDGVVIDGAQEISIDIDAVFDHWGEAPSSRPEMLLHPFANAHIVNHPPKDAQPNVLQFLLDIDIMALPPQLSLLVPVRPSDAPLGRLDVLENAAIRQRVKQLAYFTSRAPNDRLLRTVALVATRHIRDEELFMDYRFNPAVSAPEWYHPCGDGQQAHRRWHSRDVFSFT